MQFQMPASFHAERQLMLPNDCQHRQGKDLFESRVFADASSTPDERNTQPDTQDLAEVQAGSLLPLRLRLPDIVHCIR